MRLFYFSRIDSAIEEASSRHVFEFCRQFARLGHSVVLFLPDLGHRREIDGVHVVYVPVFIRRPSVTFFTFYFSLFFFFLFYYFRFRPQVVYTRHQQMEWVVTWLRAVLSFLYVVEVNGLSTVELRIHSKPEWIVTATRWLEGIVFHLADRIVTPSDRIRDALCRDYRLDPEKFLVVTNGADPETFRPMDPRECRDKLGLDPDGKYLIFVGSFRRWHGISRLVSMFPQLLGRVPEVRLLLVGQGDEQDAIRRFIAENRLQDRVLLLGQKKFEEIPVYINAADICLAPYFDTLLNETGISPLKIYEYMACGKPVISSPMGGLELLFQAHEIGLLVDSPEPSAWVDPLERLIHDPRRMEKYGAQARQAVCKEFSWEAVCGKIARTLQQAMAAKG